LNKPSFNSLSDILPNTWHWGVGMELIFLRNITGIHRGIDLSLRAEYSVFYNNLALDLSHVSLRNLALAFPTYGDIPKSETAARQNINLIFTLSY
jgi:hypothetical protein